MQASNGIQLTVNYFVADVQRKEEFFLPGPDVGSAEVQQFLSEQPGLPAASWVICEEGNMMALASGERVRALILAQRGPTSLEMS